VNFTLTLSFLVPIARFDVLRYGKKGKNKYGVGVVSNVDFSGEVKRILFHFPKLIAKFDEWIEFGSERIARLHTKTSPPDSTVSKKVGEKSSKKNTDPAASTSVVPEDNKDNVDSLVKNDEKMEGSPADEISHLDEKNFTIGGTYLSA
jgi:hypothetical protein